MRRRPLLGAGLALAACQRIAFAQPAARKPKIGWFSAATPEPATLRSQVEPFRQGLREIGWIEGQNLAAIEFRWAEGRFERLPALLDELLRLDLDVLVTTSPRPAMLAKEATKTIPIVALGVDDPVQMGLAASIARPGGNITGISNNLPAMVPKQIELLREIVPGLQRVAFLGSTEDKATPIFVGQATSAAAALGVKLQVVLIGQASEFESAAAAMARERAQAVVVQPLFTLGSSAALGDVLARHKLPSISALRPYALAGGLSSYGANRTDQWRRAVSFIDRVLKGAKPATLPVEEPTTYELVLNLKTAKTIGLVVPPSLLQRADEVIQ